MKGLLLGLLLAASHSPPATTVSHQSSDWKLNGELASHCALAVLGNARETSGARITVQCDGEEELTGNVVLKLSALNLQHRRISVVADVQQDERMSSTLWIKSSRGNRTVLFESDAEDALFNPQTGLQRSIASVVAKDADVVSMGLMLHGNGVVTVKNIHITVSGEGSISSQAKGVLDMALDVIRQHAGHNASDWAALNVQAEQFASGAQQTADVYPVIRYVLQQLGDKSSTVLSPEIVRSLDHRKSSPSTTVKIVALPDGAELVLTATSLDHASDGRVANNWP